MLGKATEQQWRDWADNAVGIDVKLGFELGRGRGKKRHQSLPHLTNFSGNLWTTVIIHPKRILGETSRLFRPNVNVGKAASSLQHVIASPHVTATRHKSVTIG